MVSYSVIIPAYNEEEWLPTTLDSVRRAMQAIDAPGEVIVVDNNSDDGTARVAEEGGARVVFEPVNQISRARNAGARAARGRYLIFVDADTQPAPELLETALRNLSEDRCCGGGGLLAPDKALPWPARVFLKCLNLFFIALCVAPGCFVYCRRDAFEEVGGFSEDLYALEELFLSRRLRAWGRKRGLRFRVIADPPVVTSVRKLEWFSPLRLALVFLVLGLFPFALRYRSLCWFWYKKPGKK